MLKHRLSLLLVVVALCLAACGTHARYQKDGFGPRIQGSPEDAVVNIKRMMSMQPRQMQQTVMKKQRETMKRGEKLFSDPKLGNGTKGQSCSSCHPGGGTIGGEAQIPKRMGHGPFNLPIPSLAGAAATFPKYKVPNDEVISLQQMNNNCIRMFMGGKRLEMDSPESYALATYVSSLSNGEEIEVGR